MATPDVVTFVVPGPAVPKVRMTQRSKYSKGAKRCLEYQGSVGTRAWCAAQDDGRPEPPLAILLEFSFADRRRRDLDNLAKTVLDGLQPAMIDDDSTKFVRQLVVTVDHVAPGEEQVRVTVIALEPDEETPGDLVPGNPAPVPPLRPEVMRHLPDRVRSAIERGSKK